ncbi:MAG: 4-hydroxy-tetrahydrodipicolinate synthase [Bdellovibrionota bacterium]|nr:MAG: 4-hydroxy-tetrahydrodipicolinate synthase [Bdellovibrionota bacterium]
MESSALQGSFTALATPFSADGSKVDFDSLSRLIEHQITNGAHGVVVCGSTGEAATLQESEYKEVVSFSVREVNQRVPVIAGIGSNDTARAVEMARWLDSTAVDGLLVVAPPYNKPPQRGIIAHFDAVHAVNKRPIVAYNIPGRTGVNILPATLAAMFDEGVIAGVKESSGVVDNTLEITALTGGRLPVLSGEDAQVVALMANGAKGVITATGNVIPETFVNMTRAALSGDFSAARAEQLAALPVVKAMFSETNPIPVKAALHMIGVISHPTVRLPLVPAEPRTIELLRSVLGAIF